MNSISKEDIIQIRSNAKAGNHSGINEIDLINLATKELKDTADTNRLVNLTEEKLDEVLAKLKQNALNHVGVGLRYLEGTTSVELTKEMERDNFRAIIPCASTINNVKLDYDIDAYGAVKLLSVIGVHYLSDGSELNDVDAYQLDSDRKRVVAYFESGSKLDTANKIVRIVPPQVYITTSTNERVPAEEFFKNKLAGAIKSSTRSLIDQIIAGDKTNNFVDKD